MANRKRVVTEHLEDVSGRILDEYPNVIKELIKKRAGIYALYKRRRLYYVGLASNLMGRLKQHLRDKHRGRWDRFSVYLTVSDDHIKELESLLLRLVAPDGNRQGGKFVRARNLKQTLNRLMKENDADRRAEIIGGNVEMRRQRSKARKARGSEALKGLVSRHIQLRGYRNGWEYRASLRKDGSIRYGDELFYTPNAAAKAAVGKPANGWRFWQYKRRNGAWVPLDNLRR